MDVEKIDWSKPWLAAVAALGRAIARGPRPVDALNDFAARAGLSSASGCAIRFVPSTIAGDAPYELHIARTGEVPTRDNRHDLFNALVWLAFPRTKARLNALQSTAIAQHGIDHRRGALRDAATLFDENGAFLVTENSELVDALQEHDWNTLFVKERSAWRSEVRAIVFGHALMDKLVTPFKGITAHALCIPLNASAPLAVVDAFVADRLDKELTPRDLLPLPILGIPCWAANDDPSYYDDLRVFRPRRREPTRPSRGLRGLQIRDPAESPTR